MTDTTTTNSLSSLQRTLRASVNELQREPAGHELWQALQQDAERQLALLEQDELTEDDGAELQALAGRVFRPARLARLIRGGIAQSVAEALGNPQAWLLVCRSLKHIPAWVLEEDAEREARVAAETEWRKTRGRRPGKRTEQELFNDDRQGMRSVGETPAATQTPAATRTPAAPRPHRPSATVDAAEAAELGLWNMPPQEAEEQPGDTEQYEDEDNGEDGDEEWTSPQLERELAELRELWRGHDPQLMDQHDPDRMGIRHYLELCRGLELCDIAALDRSCLPPRIDMSHWTKHEVLARCKRIWRDIASGPPARPLTFWKDGRLLGVDFAIQRLRMMRHIEA